MANMFYEKDRVKILQCRRVRAKGMYGCVCASRDYQPSLPPKDYEDISISMFVLELMEPYVLGIQIPLVPWS